MGVEKTYEKEGKKKLADMSVIRFSKLKAFFLIVILDTGCCAASRAESVRISLMC